MAPGVLNARGMTSEFSQESTRPAATTPLLLVSLAAPAYPVGAQGTVFHINLEMTF
jgi:hypothetical protein